MLAERVEWGEVGKFSHRVHMAAVLADCRMALVDTESAISPGLPTYLVQKPFRLDCQVGVTPMELLASHTHHRKTNDFPVRNCLNTSQVSPTFAYTICAYAV